MKTERSPKFRMLDMAYLAMILLPLLFGMVLKILTKPASEGISITGAQVYFTIPMPLQDFPITESQVNSWIVIIAVLGVCLYITHGIRAGVETKRQLAAEWLVEKTQSLVHTNMGEDKYYGGFPPFVAAILALSALSSLLTLIGLYPPTSDMNVVGGWAIIAFVLITYYKLKCGPGHYVKSLCDPILLSPLNIISEIATPISMAFRHYGNILSGTVISVLVASALGGLSKMLVGWLPGIFSDMPILQVGLPAILSVYFDIFSGCLQAFIFAMLTMLYISNGFAVDDYEELKRKKQKKTAESHASDAVRQN